jgi:uncharacterized membrane protein YphA (DoxX/SURF4 family)
MAGERKTGGKGIMKAHGLPLFETIVRIAIAAVFLWSGSAKLVHPGAFADRLEGFQLLPWPWLVTMVAVTLPVLEIMLAILLWIGPWRRAALLLCAAMGLLFCGVLLSAQLRGLTADCGCFGAGEVTPLTLPPFSLLPPRLPMPSSQNQWNRPSPISSNQRHHDSPTARITDGTRPPQRWTRGIALVA